MNTIKKNIYLFIGYFLINIVLYIIKLVVEDIYFKLGDLCAPIQVINTLNHVPMLFKISFTSFGQVLENVIIGKIIN